MKSQLLNLVILNTIDSDDPINEFNEVTKLLKKMIK